MEGWQIKTSETEPASELGFEFTEGGMGGDRRKGNKSYNSSVIKRIDYSHHERLRKLAKTTVLIHLTTDLRLKFFACICPVINWA